jgi:hypothetical protein
MPTSALRWLDFSEHERRKAHEVISLFQEQDTRDELGVGAVRDAFAGLLFPGTGTLQTRAAYFLLVPWMYLEVEAKKVASRDVAVRTRVTEVKLIDILAVSPDPAGTIGIQARASLQRLPSSIYWQGLYVLGIRIFPGSQDSYHRSLDSFYLARQSDRRNDDDEPVAGTTVRNWHHAIPRCPPGFPKEASLSLRKGDAEYLLERLLSRAPDSLFALFLARKYAPEDVDYPWQHPRLTEFPSRLREQLDHARNFSDAIHGAALLYNLMLAEKAPREPEIELYRDQLKEWHRQMGEHHATFAQWDRAQFWRLLDSTGAHITPQTRSFIDTWLDIARSSRDVAAEERPRGLVQARERALKRAQARLDNPRALEQWGGASGTRPLNYRWPVAKTMISDIQTGLVREATHA